MQPDVAAEGSIGSRNLLTLLSSGDIVTTANSGDIHVWNPRKLQHGQAKSTLKGHTQIVTAATDLISTVSKMLSGSSDGTLKVWQLDSGLSEYTLEGHKAP